MINHRLARTVPELLEQRNQIQSRLAELKIKLGETENALERSEIRDDMRALLLNATVYDVGASVIDALRCLIKG